MVFDDPISWLSREGAGKGGKEEEEEEERRIGGQTDRQAGRGEPIALSNHALALQSIYICLYASPERAMQRAFRHGRIDANYAERIAYRSL